MSTPLDLILVPVAKDLIDRLGTDMQWTQVVGDDSSANIVQGTARNSTPVAITIKASPPAPLKIGMVQTDVMIAGRTVIYAYPSQFTETPGIGAFEPKEGAKVTLNDGLSYSVTGVSPIYSGDDLAVYEIDVKR